VSLADLDMSPLGAVLELWLEGEEEELAANLEGGGELPEAELEEGE